MGRLRSCLGWRHRTQTGCAVSGACPHTLHVCMHSVVRVSLCVREPHSMQAVCPAFAAVMHACMHACMHARMHARTLAKGARMHATLHPAPSSRIHAAAAPTTPTGLPKRAQDAPFHIEHRTYERQYAQLYFARLNMMKPALHKQIAHKWPHASGGCAAARS